MTAVNQVGLVSFSGQSGAGKTTLAKRILSILNGVRVLQSHTTRPAGTRNPEDVLPGEYAHYPFDEWTQRQQSGEFFKGGVFYAGNYYGTLLSDLKEITSGDQLYIASLTPQKAVELTEHCQGHTLNFYVESLAREELEQRCLARGEISSEELDRRMSESAGWDEYALHQQADLFILIKQGTRDEMLEQVLHHLEPHWRRQHEHHALLHAQSQLSYQLPQHSGGHFTFVPSPA